MCTKPEPVAVVPLSLGDETDFEEPAVMLSVPASKTVHDMSFSSPLL